MPRRRRPRTHAGNLQAQRAPAQQSHHPADRSNEAQPRRASPIHRLGPRNLRNRPGNYFRQPFGGGSSGYKLIHGHVFTLRRAYDEELVYSHAMLRGESFGHPGRSILLIERRPLGRAHRLALDVLLLQPNARASSHQPPRRAERGHFRPIEQFFERQIFVKDYLKFARRVRNHARGNLFTADFQKKLRESSLRGCLRFRLRLRSHALTSAGLSACGGSGGAERCAR